MKTWLCLVVFLSAIVCVSAQHFENKVLTGGISLMRMGSPAGVPHTVATYQLQMTYEKSALRYGFGASTFGMSYDESVTLPPLLVWLMLRPFDFLFDTNSGIPTVVYNAKGKMRSYFMYGHVSYDWLDKNDKFDFYQSLQLGIRVWKNTGEATFSVDGQPTRRTDFIDPFVDETAIGGHLTILGFRYNMEHISLGSELGYGPRFTLGGNVAYRF